MKQNGKLVPIDQYVPPMPANFMPPQPTITTNEKGEKVLKNFDGSTVPIVTQPDGTMAVK